MDALVRLPRNMRSSSANDIAMISSGRSCDRRSIQHAIEREAFPIDRF